jgi:hypothetical protein
MPPIVDSISRHAATVRAGVGASPIWSLWKIATDFVHWTPTLHQASLLSDARLGVFSTGPKAMPMTLLYMEAQSADLTNRHTLSYAHLSLCLVQTCNCASVAFPYTALGFTEPV